MEDLNSTGLNNTSGQEPLENPVTILIAEDDEANHLFFTEMLKLERFHTIVVNNGQEAVDAVKDFPEIMLVLMDIRMPIMDGVEATKIIKKMRADLPIIALTAFAMKGEDKLMLDAGCDDYLLKPVRVGMLLSKIRDNLDKFSKT
jgi:CheY-like chemotaxis protein